MSTETCLLSRWHNFSTLQASTGAEGPQHGESQPLQRFQVPVTNISPGSDVCWWDTCTCSHRTAPPDRGEAQLSSAMALLTSGRLRALRHCCHSEQELPGATSSAECWATAWLNGHLPLCSKISPVISWTKGSPSKTSGADHTVAALMYTSPSSYNAKQWGGEKGHLTQVFEIFLVTKNEGSTSLWIKYFRFVWIKIFNSCKSQILSKYGLHELWLAYLLLEHRFLPPTRVKCLSYEKLCILAISV